LDGIGAEQSRGRSQIVQSLVAEKGQRVTDKDRSEEVTGEATSAFPRAEFLNEADAFPTVGRDSTVCGVDKLPTGSALLVVK
jgi:hypothetical protein